ncbi:MAG: hypothetical protein EBZ36_07390 [Acidobacteria bacterium]|nr:hypothetical protein [Acidobacteriota bacterium]
MPVLDDHFFRNFQEEVSSMSETPGPITELIQRVRSGDEAARNELWERLYPLLRQRAVAMMRVDEVGGVARPSDILQGAFVKLLAREKLGWNDSHHLIRYASAVMRNLITDLARGQLKRARVGTPLSGQFHLPINHDVSWVEVDEALMRQERLENQNPALTEENVEG